MAIVAVIVRIMPESPETNLSEIQQKAKSSLESHGAKNISFEIIPVAFGLKSLNVKFAWPEEKDTLLFESSLSKLPHVSSAETIDYRRAFG